MKKFLCYIVAMAITLSLVIPSGAMMVYAETATQPESVAIDDTMQSVEADNTQEDVSNVESNEDNGSLAKRSQLSLEPVVEESGEEIADEDVAVIMTQNKVKSKHKSVNEALAVAKDGITAEIVLQKNIKEDIVIEAGKKVKLYLNGHTITNVKSHTIQNKAKSLYIYGGETSSDKTKVGTVDNVTHCKAAIYGDINSRTYLKGGNFTRSQEASTSDTVSGSNSYYVIKNFGYMSISDGVNVKFSNGNPGLYSSLIGSGWQDAANAEAGKNGEPKPSAGSNKATLSISGGTFEGGQITIKNDDYGVLIVSGGTIIQPSDGRAAIANNNIATISGGTIEAKGANGQAVYSRYFDTNGANTGTLKILGGTFKSRGMVVQAQKGSSLEITNGIFETTGKDNYIIEVADTAVATIKNGKYIGVGIDKLVNRNDVFAEEYAPKLDIDGSIIVDIQDTLAAVVVIDKSGSVKNFKDLNTAFDEVKTGATVRLQNDIVLSKPAKTAKGYADITLDLNGFNVDGKATDEVIYMRPGYGWKPIDGAPNKMSIINSRPGQGGEIIGKKPWIISSGDSRYRIAGEIGEGVKLVTTDENANAVKLETGAYLIYGDTTKDLIKNGGFKITDKAGTECIYGDYANAVGNSADSKVTMLHDYRGNEKISSGSNDGTFDLNGNLYTYEGIGSVIDVNHPKVTLTVKNGKIIATDETCDGAHLIGAPNENQMNNRGLILDGIELTVSGDVYGIVTNGTETGNKVVLKDSVLNVKEGAGIYFPSAGEVTIDNSVINAKHTGVQMCAGALTVDGEKTKITVTGEPQEKIEGDGVIADGAAISVIERAGYKNLELVNIKTGEFKAANGVNAIQAYKFEENYKKDWPEAGEVVDVTGGSFSTVVPENICGDKFVPTKIDPETGMATVVKDEIAPVIKSKKTGTALSEGTYYGGKIEFTVDEEHLKRVTVNDNVLTASNSVYAISGKGEFNIVAEDTVGNSTKVTVTLAEIGKKGMVTEDSVTIGDKLVYNGKEQIQEIKVEVDGVVLKEGTDYEVTGNKATEVGKYTLTVKGIGDYEGSVEVGYEIINAHVPVEPNDPDNQDGTTSNGESGKAENDRAKTGDPITLGLLIAALGISGAGIAGLRRKK